MHFSFTRNPLSLEMSGPRVCVVNLQADKNKKDTRRSAHAHIAYFHEITHACRNARHEVLHTVIARRSEFIRHLTACLLSQLFFFLLVNIGFFELPIIRYNGWPVLCFLRLLPSPLRLHRKTHTDSRTGSAQAKT